MIKKILSIAALSLVFLSQTNVNAQDLKSEAKFWIKGSKSKGAISLNGNYPISDEYKGSLIAPLGENASNYYVVFQSLDNKPVDLVDFNMKCYQHQITTENINFKETDSVIQEKIKTGAIVKYGFDLKDYKVTDEFMYVNNEKDQTFIYEIIYINKAFSEKDHKHMQTYLSMKYGVSLLDVTNYLSKNDAVLWNSNLDQDANKFIIGIGKSDVYEINKTESINSIDKLLTISSKSLNNEEYIFVGNNGKSNVFSDQGNQLTLNKTFLAQTTSKNKEIVDLKFDTALISDFQFSNVYYLNVNDDLKIQGSIENNKLVFSNVTFNSDNTGIDRFFVSSEKISIKVDLAEAWFLNDKGQVTLKPVLELSGNEKYDVSWFYNGKKITNTVDAIVNKTGEYEMQFTANNSTQNYKTTVYDVLESGKSENIQVYPNPITAGQTFEISYNLKAASNVEVYIYQSNGKFVTKKDLGTIENETFKYELQSSGVYILISKINNKSTIQKLIVK